MPKIPRIISKTNIYHIMCRGNNKSDIFFDDDDYNYYLEILKRIKKRDKYLIFAFCLMKNHVHLLIDAKESSISKIMQKINLIYVIYINKKYQRIGHLFQGRFKSEPVENENYLLTAVRYIHNNPVKGEITSFPVDYKWSSYHDFLKKGTETRSMCPLTDTDFILNLFNNSIEKFIEYTLEKNDDNLIEMNDERIYQITSVKDGEKFINDFLKNNNIDLISINVISNVDIRNKLIRELKEKSSFSIISISKLLGVGTKIVRRA